MIRFIVQRPRLHLDEKSRDRCQRINDLREIERRWSRLSTEGHFRKVGLWLTKAVELIDALLEMGISNTINGLVIFVIFIF